MATKKPVVLDSGELRQIRQGDVIDPAYGGTGVTSLSELQQVLGVPSNLVSADANNKATVGSDGGVFVSLQTNTVSAYLAARDSI